MRTPWKQLGTAAGVLFMAVTTAQAELPSAEKIQSAAAKDAINNYEKEKLEIDTIYRGVVRDLNDKFFSAMKANRKTLQDAFEAARKEAAANDQLDQALMLRDAAQEVSEIAIGLPGTESPDAPSANPNERPRAADATGLADLSTQQLEEKLVGTWVGHDGTKVEFLPDAKIKSNHRMPLFQSGAFYLRTQDDVIYVGIVRPKHGCGMLKLVDLNTLITVNTRPTLALTRQRD